MIDEKHQIEVRRAANILLTIPWVGTQKGGRYWMEVYEELMRIAREGEP